MIEGANGAAGAQGMVEGVVAMLCWERERDGEYKIVDEFPDLGLRSHERTTGTEEGIIVCTYRDRGTDWCLQTVALV
jgi:hypothetical protein